MKYKEIKTGDTVEVHRFVRFENSRQKLILYSRGDDYYVKEYTEFLEMFISEET